MPIDLREYKALTFDCYGTLIDWEAGLTPILRNWAERSSVRSDDEDLLAAFGEAEAAAESEHPTLLYPNILRLVLQMMAVRFGVATDPQAEDDLARSVGEWPAFPDSRDALRALKIHYKLGILSNIDRASFARSNQRLGVEFDLIVTAEDVGSYKPDERNFRALLAKLAEARIAPDRVLHVAQSLYHDHVPAQRLGLRTVWINRRMGKVAPGATVSPEVLVFPDLEFSSMEAFSEAVSRAFASP